MQRKKVGLSLFVVGAVLLGLATWGVLLWYGFGIRTPFPFGTYEYPAIPENAPLAPPPPGFPYWGGIHLYLWMYIGHAAPMLMLIGGLLMARAQKEAG